MGQEQAMNGYAFTFGGAPLIALPGRALFWPARGLLVISDLHLGKSERLARRGGSLLPPYDVAATLGRLSDDLDRTGARAVICLGDSFDDGAAGGALEDADRQTLMRLMAGRDWTWIAGNHDPGPVDLGGTHRDEVLLAGLRFRHVAGAGEEPEVSGHYHPKTRLAGQARACFVTDGRRLILPAYGAYTGGLWCSDPAIADLLGPGAVAVLTGTRAIAVPLARHARLSGGKPFRFNEAM
jgi:hypothetical protein